MSLKLLLYKIGPSQLNKAPQLMSGRKNVRRFRKWSKGWSKNIESERINPKKDLMEEYDSLDIKAETEELSPLEKARLKNIYAEMHNLWLKEEIKAKQRSRDKDIKEADRNTAYFHSVANQRRRKILVHSHDGLMGPSQMMLKCLIWQHPSTKTYLKRMTLLVVD
jgi:hypothetical protein